MEYASYKYIYPPRPEKSVHHSSLGLFVEDYIAQPKLNGSLMMVYTDGKSLHLMNRHKTTLSCKIPKEELLALHRGTGWMVLCGEYMNKAKKDEQGKLWNHKFVVFDIVVYNNDYLLGTTFDERYDLLRELYPDNLVKPHIHSISNNCFRVNSIRYSFANMYYDIVKHDMYEGIVMKKGIAKLQNGMIQQQVNVNSQVKCRKPTKNYLF